MMLIDQLDKLVVDDRRHFNELRSLSYLAKGMEFLNAQVGEFEMVVASQLDQKSNVFMVGNAPPLRGVPQDLIACAFHWYSVTACNYVKLVGWLANEGDSSRAASYLKSVIPEVQRWRNKIGAHFAGINPRTDDTAADLAGSVMFPISFEDDTFYAGAIRLIMTKGGESSSTRTDMRWSLTNVHRTLATRYWPTERSSDTN